MKRVPFWDPLMFNDEQRQPLPPHGFPLRSLERFWTSLNLCTSWSWFLKIIFALGQKWWHYLTGHTHAVNLRQPWTTIRSWQDMHWQKYKHYTQLAYTLSLWKRLNGYLLDGKYEIDNNLIENSIRPVALGRKNYLFAGSHDAAQSTAMLYSFLGSCKMNDVEPSAWLKDV